MPWEHSQHILLDPVFGTEFVKLIPVQNADTANDTTCVWNVNAGRVYASGPKRVIHFRKKKGVVCEIAITFLSIGSYRILCPAVGFPHGARSGA